MEKQERQKVKKNFVVQDGQIIVIEEMQFQLTNATLGREEKSDLGHVLVQ